MCIQFTKLDLVAQLAVRQVCREFEPQLGHITSVEIDYEIISMAILSLPLMQVAKQLSVTGESMRTYEV